MKDKHSIKVELANFYKDKEAEDYDSLRNTASSDRKLISIQKNIINNLVNNLAGKKILDVACGTGFFFSEYKNKEIYGVDISEDMLSMAKSRHLKDVKLLKKSDATHLPFKDNFFDIAITSKFIMHTPEYLESIGEMVRVTKKDGAIILDLPNKNSFSYLFTKRRIKQGKIRYYNFFTKQDINGICTKFNLKLDKKIGTTILTYRTVPEFLYWFIDFLNILPFLKNNFAYVYYVRLIKND
ncbi:MAG: class I SAM-dependent methyltransferase [Candidatus Pacearchaeota archaeon]|jgi:ubiquinone/menaquinone biosynthesis C-methylase UbiE